MTTEHDHIHRDLHSTKYRQRVKPNKKREAALEALNQLVEAAGEADRMESAPYEDEESCRWRERMVMSLEQAYQWRRRIALKGWRTRRRNERNKK